MDKWQIKYLTELTEGIAAVTNMVSLLDGLLVGQICAWIKMFFDLLKAFVNIICTSF